MSPSILRIRSDDKLPERADAVVIGGGIVGVSTAYFLAKRGLSVAILEKGYIGAEQSSRNWGRGRQQNRDARELPLASKSLDLWERFAAASGEDAGFHRCGLLAWAPAKAAFAASQSPRSSRRRAVSRRPRSAITGSALPSSRSAAQVAPAARRRLGLMGGAVAHQALGRVGSAQRAGPSRRAHRRAKPMC